MVNHGASGACKTCKIRRKKCDETRPSCQRCEKAGRTCLGYQDSTDLHFRRYRGITNRLSYGQYSPEFSQQSNQYFPRPLESLPGSFVDAQIEGHALAAFLHDYCLVPEHHLLSRGYLDGLKTLLSDAGPSSDLVQATKVVALASIGTKLNRPGLVHKARIMYLEMLQSLQVMISNAGMARTAESLMTAVLLGLYEIITATEAHPSNHSSHSCGVYAILSTKSAPLDLLNWGNRFQISNPLLLDGPLKGAGILCAPTSHQSALSLYALAVKSWPLLQTAEALLSSTSTLVADLHQLLKDAKLLNGEFSKWPASQPLEWRPRTIGFINPGEVTCAQGFGSLPGRIDTYLDLYVAAIWNTYRKTRLLLLNAIIRCSNRLEKRNTCHNEKINIEELANDMAASIPFHLSENLSAFVEQAENGFELAIVPGKSVGGLLLMHPLFVMSNLPVILPKLQVHMKECLAWIGTHMGIGQATWLSKTPASFPNESVAHGYAIIWAGMLFTRFEDR